MKREIKFLGHIIDENRIKRDGKKIEAIQKFERPRSTKLIRNFLGLVNYYYQFIKDSNKYSKLLESLCGNSKKTVWIGDHVSLVTMKPLLLMVKVSLPKPQF